MGRQAPNRVTLTTQIKTALTQALLDQRPDFDEMWLRGSLLGRLSTPDEFRGEHQTDEPGTDTKAPSCTSSPRLAAL